MMKRTIKITLAIAIMAVAFGAGCGDDNGYDPYYWGWNTSTFQLRQIDPPENSPIDQFTKITLYFTEPVDAVSLKNGFSIKEYCTNTGSRRIVGSFSLTGQDREAVFIPDAATPLRSGCRYEISVSSEVKSKLTGAPLYNPVASYVIGTASMASSDPNKRPKVISIDPSGGCPYSTITVTFSEPMDPNGVYIQLYAVQQVWGSDNNVEQPFPVDSYTVRTFPNDTSVWEIIPPPTAYGDPYTWCGASGMTYRIKIMQQSYDLDGQKLKKTFVKDYHL